MKLFHRLVSMLAAVELAAAYLVAPPGTAAPGTTSACSLWVQMSYTLTCSIIESYFGLTAAQFQSWNPSVTELGAGCNLITGLYYCVQVNFVTMSTGFPSTLTGPATHPTTFPTTVTTMITTTTTTGNGPSTPSPIQTGMASNCNKFYKVVSGDTCSTIASNANIALSDFYSWNPAVGSTCSTLLLDDYVCIGVIGSPTSTTTTSSSSGNGVSTPSPIQTGMVANCNKFYEVVTGDGCSAIAAAAGISLATFYAWNPAVGSTCTTLFVGDYVCIGVVVSTSTGPTTSGNGISTPSPIQTGMVSNCNKFHQVVSGDGCSAIATAAGILLATFYAWNPAVGSTCTTLLLGDYVCIGIVGSTSTGTTTSGNGVSTPNPIQTGMVSNCNTFHQVVSGDGCSAIATAAGISLAVFYSWNPAVGSTCTTLIIGDFVCIGVLGSTPTTTTPTTSSQGNGVITPTPTQAGMVNNCDKFHDVVSGDSCAAIASSASISLDNFYKWNPGVGSSCASLWLGYYVCTGTLS